MDNFQKLNGEASWTKPLASHSLWAECRKLLGIEGTHTRHISFVFPPEWRAGINNLKGCFLALLHWDSIGDLFTKVCWDFSDKGMREMGKGWGCETKWYGTKIDMNPRHFLGFVQQANEQLVLLILVHVCHLFQGVLQGAKAKDYREIHLLNIFRVSLNACHGFYVG